MATIKQDKPFKLDDPNQQTSAPNMSSINSPAQGTGPIQETKPQASGSFTNLKQYLTANKNAGQGLVSGIGNNIQKKIDPAKKQAADYNSKVAEGIKSAQENLASGGQNLQQLKNINQNIQNNTGGEFYGQNNDLGIQSFTNDPNYSKFKNLQAGNAINENQMNVNQNVLTNAAKDYYNTANENLTNLGSEGGRFQLLKSTFGGNVNPQYSTGQQRLDQLFLQNQGGLGDLKNKVANEVRSADQLNRGAVSSGRETANAVAAEQNLINDINNQSGQNEQAYLKMLESYIPTVNEQRGAQWNSLDNALKNGGKGLTAEQIADLGVNGPMKIYNTFKNITGASDVAVRGADAQNYGDVANQADVLNYSALANILGMKPEDQRLTKASELGKAYENRTDEGSLLNRIAQAAKVYDDKSKGLVRTIENGVSYINPHNVSGTYADALNDKMIYGRWGNGYAQPDKGVDNDLLRFINEEGVGNVLTPEGIVDTSKGLKNHIGEGSVKGAGYGDSYINQQRVEYNSNLDNLLRQAWNDIVNKNNKAF